MAENLMPLVLLTLIVGFCVDATQSTKVVNETATGTVINGAQINRTVVVLHENFMVCGKRFYLFCFVFKLNFVTSNVLLLFGSIKFE